MTLKNREVSFIAGLLFVLLGGIGRRAGMSEDRKSEDAAKASPPMPRLNMVGQYGPWLSEKVLGDGPARLSFRTDKWKSLDEWRVVARARVWECMAPVDLGGQPEVRLDSTHEFDGLHIERLSWQLPLCRRWSVRTALV